MFHVGFENISTTILSDSHLIIVCLLVWRSLGDWSNHPRIRQIILFRVAATKKMASSINSASSVSQQCFIQVVWRDLFVSSLLTTPLKDKEFLPVNDQSCSIAPTGASITQKKMFWEEDIYDTFYEAKVLVFTYLLGRNTIIKVKMWMLSFDCFLLQEVDTYMTLSRKRSHLKVHKKGKQAARQRSSRPWIRNESNREKWVRSNRGFFFHKFS